jgi:hypothetical protein
MHVQLQLRIVRDEGTVFTDNEILRFKKSLRRLKALDLSLQEDKTLQEHLQRQVVTALVHGLRQPASPLLCLEVASCAARDGT